MQTPQRDDDPKPTDSQPSMLRELSTRYRNVVFSSLVTSFGLDAVLFQNDERGGHVDTLHNVREAAENKEERLFKSKKHQENYENRGDYDPSLYHKDPRYIEKNRRDSELKRAGELRDKYTGEIVAKDAKTDLDHALSAKTIHDDPLRALSGNDPVATANHESNLYSTHRSINRSKRADSPSEFIERNEKNKAARQLEIERLQERAVTDSLSDQERKRLESLSVCPEGSCRIA